MFSGLNDSPSYITFIYALEFLCRELYQAGAPSELLWCNHELYHLTENPFEVFLKLQGLTIAMGVSTALLWVDATFINKYNSLSTALT